MPQGKKNRPTRGETDDPRTPDQPDQPDQLDDPEAPETEEDPEEVEQAPSPPVEAPVQAGSTPHPTTVRGPIESEFNKQRDEREQKYREDRGKLEREYLDDVSSIQESKSKELVGAGLNPDGGTPSHYGVE